MEVHVHAYHWSIKSTGCVLGKLTALSSKSLVLTRSRPIKNTKIYILSHFLRISEPFGHLVDEFAPVCKVWIRHWLGIIECNDYLLLLIAVIMVIIDNALYSLLQLVEQHEGIMCQFISLANPHSGLLIASFKNWTELFSEYKIIVFFESKLHSL